MGTTNVTTDQSRTQIIHVSNPGGFSFFRAPAQSVRPLKEVNIQGVYNHITLYKPAMDATCALRNITDAKEARKFKSEHFDFVTFSGTFSYRKDDCLVKHSGLLCLDFDHIGGHKAVWDFRTQLLADPNFNTWLLFVSPSGDGLKWVIGIDLNLCDHLTWFRAMQNYCRMNYHVEIDRNCCNVSRACFLPHDPTCYVNPIILQQQGVCPF